MPAIYLDASALVKLVVEELESAALRAFLQRAEGTVVSSIVASVEVPRAALRARGGSADGLMRAFEALSDVALVELDSETIERAVRIEPATLRSLDAIHLASALALGDELEHFVAYDGRLSATAAAAGLQVVAPR